MTGTESVAHEHTGREFRRNKFNRKKEEGGRGGGGRKRRSTRGGEKEKEKEKKKRNCMGLDMFKFIFSYSAT